MSPLLGSSGLVSYYSYRGNIDTLPDPFSIGADVVNVEINAEITRTVAAITGINYKARVTPSSGATISVNGSAYTSTSQYVRNNQSVSIKFTPTDFDSNYTVTLTVGKRFDSYIVGTRSGPADSIPNQFDFINQTDIDPPGKTNVESNIVTLSGMSLLSAGARPEDFGTASISGNSAEFKVTRNGTVQRNYSTANFQVLQGDQIQLKMSAGGNAQTVSTTFSVTGTDNTNLASPVTSTISDSFSITSKNYVASISISANPGSVAYNTPTSISWSSENITLPITITNIGNVNTASGSRTSSNLNKGAGGGSETFTATANALYSPPASTSASVSVNVGVPPAPSVSLSATNLNIAYNGSTTLNWSSSNATSTRSSTDNFAGSSTSGGPISTGNLTRSKTYLITVNGLEGQTASSSVTVNVAAAPVPSVDLTAANLNIAYNGSTTLSWTSSNATGVRASTDNFAGSSTSGGPTSTGNLTQSKQYTIVLDGLEGQTATDTVTVNVPEEPEIVKYITSNTTNADAQSYFGSTDWTRSVRKRLIVNGGVVVGSTNPSAAALIITAGVVGAFVLENNGSIQGAGGLGGIANGGNGGKGGNAIIINNKGTGGTVSITNNGSILAGGGGGGAGTKGGTGGRGGDGSYTYLASQSFPDAGTCNSNFNLCFIGAPHPGRTAACNIYNAICCGSLNGCPNNQYATESTTGGNGGLGGNGGNGGVGEGYAQNTGSGAGGAQGAGGTAGGQNAGTGGQGGIGGTGGNGGGLGVDGSNGSQGATGNTGDNGNVTNGTGGTGAELPVGIRGLAGYYINGIDNLNGGVGGTVGGRTKNLATPATSN